MHLLLNHVKRHVKSGCLSLCNVEVGVTFADILLLKNCIRSWKQNLCLYRKWSAKGETHTFILGGETTRRGELSCLTWWKAQNETVFFWSKFHLVLHSGICGTYRLAHCVERNVFGFQAFLYLLFLFIWLGIKMSSSRLLPLTSKTVSASYL